jgi:hypothetical protein
MPDSSAAVLGKVAWTFLFRTDLRDEHGGAPGPSRVPMDRGRSSGASSRFLLLVARGVLWFTGLGCTSSQLDNAR